MIASLHRSWHWPGLRFRTGALLHAVVVRVGQGHLRAVPAVAGHVVNAPVGNAETVDQIAARYGDAQFSLLRAIMAYCRDHNIPVILASVPGREGARAVAASHGQAETPHQRETRMLAAYFGALYMDGYAPFARVPPADIDTRYWLTFDGHWNQAGSDLFADAMTDFLRAHQGELAGHRQVSASTPQEPDSKNN